MYIQKIEGFNIEFTGLSREFILSKLNSKKLNIVITVNAEIVIIANEDTKFKGILRDSITTIDGQIPYLFLRMKYPKMQFEKLPGSELIYYICEECSKRGLKVFLLGTSKTANRLARIKLKRMYPRLKITGYSPPFLDYPFPQDVNSCILSKIESFRTDVLFVAFGPPKQEMWLYNNRERLESLGLRIAVGVGGALNMVAGIEKRAPKLVQNIGLESVWRLIQNPKRAKRFIRNFKFFKYVFCLHYMLFTVLYSH